MKRYLALLLCCLLIPVGAFAADGLYVGSKGDAVTALQNRLAELGLFSGKVDGIYGNQTVAAVTEAQRLLKRAEYDVPQDGNADAATLSLILSEDAKAALTVLCVGSKGPRVQALQTQLIDLKLLNGAADGAYGNATKQAVADFQQKASAVGLSGLTVNGVVDDATQAALESDLGSYGFRAPIYFDLSKPLELTEEYLYSKSCIVMDVPSGDALFEVNSDEILYPASTTKIMTLLLALESGGLSNTVTIPDEAADVAKDSSLVPVVPGETMTKLDLLYGLMIRSGNDAAKAVAVLEAGSIDAFVERMNQKAAELQMSNTHFANPHGYHDPDHYSTARDLALAARAGLTDPTFCQIVSCLRYTLPATDKREALTIENNYEIFNPESPYYLSYAAGVKSGYTSLAGFCYVGAAQKNGRTLIAVLMGAPSRNRAWMDLQKLFEYGFAR
ncbi:MAG: peptidoglycan-binding protein [Eubacteriales bacterium]|nr:peptidoglycan-binding protein [Eubacteriales bacterium]